MKEAHHYELVKIDKIVVDRFQVRKANTGEGLDELAANLEKFGLLQPVGLVKYDKDPKKWELIWGQRRMLAHKLLKRTEIMARIIPGKLSLEEGLAMSGAENVFQLEMVRPDLVDLCEELFKKYGTLKAVQQRTSLPYEIVKKHVRYSRLVPFFKKLVDKKTLDVDLALKAQDAASSSGKCNEAEAKKLVKVLLKSDDNLRRRILEVKRANPASPIEKVVKRAEEPVKTLKVTMLLGANQGDALRQYADEEGKDTNNAAQDLLQEALSSNGYLKTT